MQSLDFELENKQGVALHFRQWHSFNARAVTCLVHGIGEHIGRYDHVAHFFSAMEMATIGFDHQGHGRTVGQRGHTHGLESMLDDVGILLKVAREKYPGRPILLYGHSMGGNLVLNHVLRRKPAIAGVVATGPLIRLPKEPSKLKVAIAQIMQLVMPNFAQANGLNLNGLSNDEAVIEAYRNDPLNHNRVSMKLGYELLQGAKFLDNFQGALPCPVLLMHGEDDPLTSPAGTEAFAKRNLENMTWKPWPGLKHEIHNETQQMKVFEFLRAWMERII